MEIDEVGKEEKEEKYFEKQQKAVEYGEGRKRMWEA